MIARYLFMKLLIPFLSFLILSSFMTSDIPSSNLSKSVISKTAPRLQAAFKKKGLVYGNPIYIRIFKEEKELELWVKKGGTFKLFKSYPICHFSGGLGSKTKRGDHQSPEGFYYVKPNQLNPWSSFHLSFNIGYPNAYDRAKNYTGSAIMVHGNCVSIGCYAMTDDLIDEIYTIINAAFENKQALFRVHSFPFKMTSSRLSKEKNNKWYPFWQNLKEGYDWFEKKRIPPNVEISNKKYIFN